MYDAWTRQREREREEWEVESKSVYKIVHRSDTSKMKSLKLIENVD